MKALWALFWSVCQMRRAPDAMPSSLSLLAAATVISMTLGIVTQFLAGSMAPLPTVVTVLVAALLDAGMLWALLAFKRQARLYMPTLTAVFGADLLLGLFALPLVLADRLLGQGPWTVLLVVAQMLLVGWNLGVRGFLYHRSAHIGIFQANVLALTLFLLNVFIAAKLFPELFKAAAAH